MNKGADKQIRVLMLMAEPTDQARLRLGEELHDIETEIERMGMEECFLFKKLMSIRAEEIQGAILKHKPHIVHFSGHGLITGQLCFEDKLGQTLPVEVQALSALFKQVTDSIQCVVLNACYSDQQAQVISQHIPFVIGMTKVISDQAAIRFAVGFYGALAAGYTYEKAYELACVQIQIAGFSEELTPILRKKQEQNRKVFYSERPEIEEQCYTTIEEPGALLRIKAAKSMGKTWLMRRIVEKARQQNYRTVVLSFKNFVNENITNDIDKFLKALCIAIAKELEVSHQVEQHWQGLESSIEKATDYLQKYILKEAETPLLLALNNVDAVFDKLAIAEDFCQMLRNWHDFARQGDDKSIIWERLRLIIVHSTEVYAAFNINSSPLGGVGLVIRLPELNSEQVQIWIQYNNLSFKEEEIEQLIILLGGHPFLLKRAIDYFKLYKPSFREFISIAPSLSGPFDGHLQELSAILQGQSFLKKAFRQVIQLDFQQPVQLNPNIARKLCCLGLTKWHNDNVIIRCKLYYDFFRKHL